VEELEAGLDSGEHENSAKLREHALQLSLDARGCRSVQRALEELPQSRAAEIALQLKGSVLRAIWSAHGNYVIQKIIRVLSISEAEFVVEELKEAGIDMVRHEYGCRVYVQLLSGNAADVRVVNLINGVVLTRTRELVADRYGHFVLEKVLEHGATSQCRDIVQALRQDLWSLVDLKPSAYIVEKALMFEAREGTEDLASELLSWDSEVLAWLASRKFGHMALRVLLQQPSLGAKLRQHLEAWGEWLMGTEGGSRVWSELGFACQTTEMWVLPCCLVMSPCHEQIPVH